MMKSGRLANLSADQSGFNFFIVIFEKVGPRALIRQNVWDCIASSTAAAFTAKKKGILNLSLMVILVLLVDSFTNR